LIDKICQKCQTQIDNENNEFQSLREGKSSNQPRRLGHLNEAVQGARTEGDQMESNAMSQISLGTAPGAGRSGMTVQDQTYFKTTHWLHTDRKKHGGQ